jgi:hypothetical protein
MTTTDSTGAEDIAAGLAELADLINFLVGAWHGFGYAAPPSPDCQPIPPLGERSADAIKGGHGAIEAIDELARKLYALRNQLVGELRKDSDIRGARVDAMLAEHRAARRPDQRASALAARMSRKDTAAGLDEQ